MNFEEALTFVRSTRILGSKLGLDNIRNLTRFLGNPQDRLRFIHVAGTNGKGSTCVFISHILREAGYRTGLFTSPHIERYNERFQVNNHIVSDRDLAAAVETVKEGVTRMLEEGMNHPTEFELNTAIALVYFQRQGCDAVVWETGLGGRLDSTNVISSSCVSVITALGYDHTQILGDTIEQIAWEKAGIIKAGCPVLVCGDNPPEALRVIRGRASELGSPIHITEFSRIRDVRGSLEGMTFHYDDLQNIRIGMIGMHQVRNATLAIHIARLLDRCGFVILPGHIYAGLAAARWPGRFEVLRRDPFLICDGAHNVQGVCVLKETLDQVFPARRPIFLMGVMKDKDYEGMAAAILPGAKAAVATRIDYDRMLDVGTLRGIMEKYCQPVFASDTIAGGLEMAFRMAEKEDLVCCFGSLYLIGEVKRIARENRDEL